MWNGMRFKYYKLTYVIAFYTRPYIIAPNVGSDKLSTSIKFILKS